jgi:hypothetical protein
MTNFEEFVISHTTHNVCFKVVPLGMKSNVKFAVGAKKKEKKRTAAAPFFSPFTTAYRNENYFPASATFLLFRLNQTLTTWLYCDTPPAPILVKA